MYVTLTARDTFLAVPGITAQAVGPACSWAFYYTLLVDYQGWSLALGRSDSFKAKGQTSQLTTGKW
jgi:hypothetical protein